MAKNNIKSKKGFTIIEVVLVLAIAGLIFLMVFIALPALQRSQRDTQRRDDMARFLSQLNQYQANNNGKVPADAAGYRSFITNYLEAGGDTFNDPSTGKKYTVGNKDDNGSVTPCTTTDCPTSTPEDVGNISDSDKSDRGIIHIYTNAKCDGENPVYVNGDRKIAIRIKLEGAGIYCGNN